MKPEYRSITMAIVVFCFLTGTSYSQSEGTNIIQEKRDFEWPEGKEMGLSLTFDDARLSQVEKGIPLLDRYGVKGTFYVLPNFAEYVDKWREAIKSGHEIGNHTIFHPCMGVYEWTRGHELENYSLEKMEEELKAANKLIKDSLGIDAVSFAYPCGHTYVGEGLNTKSYVPIVAWLFETGRRASPGEANTPAVCNMSQLAAMQLDGKSFEEIKKKIEVAKSKGQWLILFGHEMNEEEGRLISKLSVIEAICQYATVPENGIWIDNVHNIVSYIKEKSREQSLSKQPVGE